MKDLLNKEREKKLIAYLEKNVRQYLTKEEWKVFLPRYVEEYFKQQPRRSAEIFNSVGEPESIIRGGFVWNLTSNPEYWPDIWSTILYRTNENLPF
jgi:hypothetical protein